MERKSPRDIASLDDNFKPATVDGRAVVWRDALAGGPFALEGLPLRAPGGPLRRLPVGEPFARFPAYGLAGHAAGACVRFRTASPWIAVRATLGPGCDMNHMPRAGSIGLDLYRGAGRAARHVGTVQPNPGERIVERMPHVRPEGDAGDETWQVNLPLYGGIDALQIGLAPGFDPASPSSTAHGSSAAKTATTAPWTASTRTTSASAAWPTPCSPPSAASASREPRFPVRPMNTTRSVPLFPEYRRGMGFGGWLTNYKRFNVLPQEWRTRLTVGDFEHFRSYLSEADAENVAAMGFDHVRVGFDQIVLEEHPGVYREEILNLLDRFCGWFESRGLGVVLNLHKAVGNYCDIHEENALLDDPALQDRFVALWEAVARRFAHRPAVAFELLNEVLDVPPEKWLALARRTVAALRRLDPRRWIVVGPTCWNNPWALRALEPFDDPRVAYTFHMYEPSAFTHQRGVLQPAHCFYNRDMPYPGDPERYRDHARETGRDPRRFDGFAEIGRDFLADVLRDAFDWKAAHPGQILWCGEFGTIRHARPAWREAWMRDVTLLLRGHGVPWCVWNYLSTPNDGNRFSLVDDDTRRILSPALLRACLGEG